MRYQITHRTQYHYEEAVPLCHNLLRLTPRDTPRQRRERFSIRIQPQPNLLEEMTDWMGNGGHYLEIHKPHRALIITATSTLWMDPVRKPDVDASPPWEEAVARTREDPEHRLDRLYLLDSPLVARSPAVLELARPSFSPGRPVLAAVAELTRRIHQEFRYSPGATTVSTPIAQVLEQRAGVCQDFAHLQIACLRAMGLAARYVSGYLETIPPPGQPKLQGVDASHAWLALLVPGLGWVDFDPTNDQIPGEQHITLAWGRDYSDVPPVKGVVVGGGRHTLEVAVDVVRQEGPIPP